MGTFELKSLAIVCANFNSNELIFVIFKKNTKTKNIFKNFKKILLKKSPTPGRQIHRSHPLKCKKSALCDLLTSIALLSLSPHKHIKILSRIFHFRKCTFAVICCQFGAHIQPPDCCCVHKVNFQLIKCKNKIHIILTLAARDY